MRIKEGFVLRQIGDDSIVVALGEGAEEFRGIIRLNETGAFLFKTIQSGVDGEDALCDALVREYSVDRETASRDVDSYVRHLQAAGLLVA